MSLWEYKVITSGKGGFATPALLEKFLNDLGRDEWEIIHYQTLPDNFLAFTGLARRSTQRDWTLEDAAAAAAKVEAEKLRAEFEAKFKAAAQPAAAQAEERAPSFLEEKASPDDGLRKLVDTSRDDDPEAAEDEKSDEWDKLTAAEEDELPTFFEAIRPHMRRNQRGPGMSVGVDYLAKKWDQADDDLKGALVECGFVVPADEDAPVEYLEYDGDLFWLNINRRGELWINTKEKPRPVFRPVKAARIVVETPKTEPVAPKEASAPTDAAAEVTPPAEGGEAPPEAPAGKPEGGRPPAAPIPLPEGAALLGKIRPHMRRNRRGPGGSGSMTFLSRALRTQETDLKAAFVALGLAVPATPGDKPAYTQLGDELWWLNLDSRGGMWINGREMKKGETIATAEAGDRSDPPAAESAPIAATGSDAIPAPEAAPAPAEEAASAPAEATTPPAEETTTTSSNPEAAPAGTAETTSPLAAMRQLLKETRTGALGGKIERLAEELGQSPDRLMAVIVEAGLKIPEKAREKPVSVEQGGEILWLSKNAKGELWLNAKASQPADPGTTASDAEGANPATGDEADTEGDKKPGRRGGRSRPKKAE